MEYSYNYNALQQFMNEHRLQKKDVLEAIGITDYVTVNKWLKGLVPIHVTAMLRFCNYYNVPVTMFFVDGDAMPPAPFPDEKSQLLPTDNYGMEGGRGHCRVETIITERNISSKEQEKAVNEGLLRQAEQQRQRDMALQQLADRTPADSTFESDTADVTQSNKIVDENELLHLKYEYRLQKIIENLQQEIQRLRLANQ